MGMVLLDAVLKLSASLSLVKLTAGTKLKVKTRGRCHVVKGGSELDCWI
jgi:hypothetical protein